MGNLLKKFNKTKLSSRLIYIFVSLLFIGGYGFLVMNLLKLTGIETKLRIIAICVLGVILIMYVAFDFLLLIAKKNKTVIVTSFLVMIISCLCIIGSLALNKAFSLLNSIHKDTVLYTTNLIVMKDTEFKNDSTFKVGMINNETDTEGYVLANEMIKEKSLRVTVTKYDTYFEMLEYLYSGELDGLFITSNYDVVYSGYDAYENIDTDVKVVYEYSKEMENQDYIESSSGSVDKPFTVLLMGVDSAKDTLNANAGFNGDTIMMITFNPNTLSATVFSLPRDTYVPICGKGISSKINSSAAYGTKCVIKTVEDLTGIGIDYYVKINFKGVVDLVDALGGITMDVEEPDYKKNRKVDCSDGNIKRICEQNSSRKFGSKMVYITPGENVHLNGEQALAYARDRHQWAAGDFKRNEHQQAVVEAIANSAKNLKSVDDFYSVLEAVSKNMDTNMSTADMLNLYNVGKSVILGAGDENLQVSIQKTYLSGYDLTMYVDNLRARVYTYQYYQESLDEIIDAMKINLELKKADMVKTFDFSVNDEYSVPVIGKGFYSVQRNETIPDFTGKNIEYVKTWCQERNITVNTTYVTQGMSGYATTLADGYVLSQNVKCGKLVKDTSSITVTVIKHTTTAQNSNTVDVTTTTTQAVEITTEATTEATTTTNNVLETN